MRQAIRESGPFLVVWALFVLLAGIAVAIVPKLLLHQQMNAWHPYLGDAAFPWITKLAEGGLAAVIILGLLFVRVRDALFVGISHGLAAVLVQSLKRGVFSDHYRPSHFLDQMPDLLLVQGVEMHSKFSFPSGHSAAIFSLCIALALVLSRRRWGWWLAVLALLVGFSRIYLSQHFLQDVLAGSTVGILVPLLLYPVFMSERLSQRWIWWNQPIKKRADSNRSAN